MGCHTYESQLNVTQNLDLDKEVWQFIQRYITGQATPEERDILHDWMNSHSENEKLIQDLTVIWRQSEEDDMDESVEDAWKRFQSGRVRKKRKQYTYKTHKKNRGVFATFLKVAAILLLALFTGLFLQYFEIIGINHGEEHHQVSEFYTMQQMTTDTGERAQLTFSDGTQVILNSASTLKFPEQFNDSTRVVHLDGEAFFKVAQNPHQPFIVEIHDTRIDVLGTEFNIRGWSEDSVVNVVVAEGKVSVNSLSQQVSDNHSEVVLKENYSTAVRRGERPSTPEKVDTRQHMLWIDGGIYFDDASVDNVFRDIERRFNVRIELGREDLKEEHYTGSFRYAELDEILSVIAASLELEYTRSGPEIRYY